jgi:peptidoglycan/LPS O-acetylase OafA/YrhL
MTEDAKDKGTKVPGTENAARWMRFLARVITGLWAGFWIFFAVASSASDFDTRGAGSLGGLLIPLAFTAVLLLLAFTAWRWERIGRIALPVAGLAALIAYPIAAKTFPVSTKMFVVAALGLPPLSAGLLLIATGRIDSGSGIPGKAGT